MAVPGNVTGDDVIGAELADKAGKEAVILIVDDDLISQAVVENMLTPHFRCITANDGHSAIHICKNENVDLVLLDMHMPEMDGITVCETLKGSTECKHIPIVFVTSADDIDTQNACWEAGASDFLVKPVVLSTLVHRVNNHVINKFRIELLNHLVYRDQLTGVYNRHYFNNELTKRLKQVVRDGKSICAAMIDIDYFKRFNDTYGHLAGDKVLVKVAKTLESKLKRPSDCLVRFGGEEFAVLLPDTEASGGKQLVEDMLKSVKSLAVPHNDSPHNVVTVSAGLFAVKPSQRVTLNNLLSSADEALYEAKVQGRNCISVRAV